MLSSTVSSSTALVSRRTTADAIDREFTQMVRSGELAECFARWASQEDALSPIEPESFVGLKGSQADLLLAAMVRIFQSTKDNRAALILQKALLPGTLRLASKMRFGGQGNDISIDDVIAQVYETLHRLPIANRPNKVAANILLDSRQHLSRENRRGQLGLIADSNTGEPVIEDSCVASAFDTVEGAMVIEAGVASFGHAKSRPEYEYIARRVLLEGHRAVDVAAELGCPARVVHDRLTHIRRAVRSELMSALG